MSFKFRLLKANEIDCRIGTIKENGLSLLLYKDARVDQNILDETVGAMNWQRSHSRENANCTVSIWDYGKGQWISKEDTGKESFTEAEKGLASDSFKRACFNWGIGRELYSAPFIWVSADKTEIEPYKGKFICKDKLRVKTIEYNENREICKLVIVGNAGVVFEYKSGDKPVIPPKETIDQPKVATLEKLIPKHGQTVEAVCRTFKVESLAELTVPQFVYLMDRMGES